jgi:hypothetical protein
MPFSLSMFSVNQNLPRHIGHVGSLEAGHMASLCPGHLTRLKTRQKLLLDKISKICYYMVTYGHR